MNDFAKLAHLIAGLGSLGESGTEVVSTELAPAVQELLDNQYSEGRGPDGKTWAPLKANGRPSHLQDTTDMSANTRALRGVRGVDVRAPSPAGFHQDGTSRMEARPLVPDGEMLPPEWEAALSETASAVIVQQLIKG
jgi:hypothetical protein